MFPDGSAGKKYYEMVKNDPEIQALQRAFQDDTFRVQLTTNPRKAIGQDTLEVSHTKRFMELWLGDPGFRKGLQSDPMGITAERGLRVNPEDIRGLWDRPIPLDGTEVEKPDLTLSELRYKVFLEHEIRCRDLMFSQGAPLNTSFRTWRQRQVKRCNNELGPVAKQLVHAPATFELSRGCSVGCWFCGVSAQKFKGHFEYTDANRALWRDVLGVMKQFCGPAVTSMFCYWATDPLDNPEYEKFCRDYYEIVGLSPQVTTAIPLRDVRRTRRIIREMNLMGSRVNRFSILTLSILHKVHKAFSPEELLFVELVPQNKESLMGKANAGRALDSPRLDRENQEPYKMNIIHSNTIACVSGFLFNMGERRVRLITPCVADHRWPEGYMVLDEARFTDGAELESVLQHMIDNQMNQAFPEGNRMAFRGAWEYGSLDDGFFVKTEHGQVTFTHPSYGFVLKELGERIREGEHQAQEIANGLQQRFHLSKDICLTLFDRIFQEGVLEEIPEPIHPAVV